MAELLPCPFCGGEARIMLEEEDRPDDSFRNVYCTVCGAQSWVKSKTEAVAAWNRRAQPENKPLTLNELREMTEERVWVQFRGTGMHGLVAYHADPDGDDGDDIYITNNLGGRNTFEEILDQGGAVYRYKPEDVTNEH